MLFDFFLLNFKKTHPLCHTWTIQKEEKLKDHTILDTWHSLVGGFGNIKNWWKHRGKGKQLPNRGSIFSFFLFPLFSLSSLFLLSISPKHNNYNINTFLFFLSPTKTPHQKKNFTLLHHYTITTLFFSSNNIFIVSRFTTTTSSTLHHNKSLFFIQQHIHTLSSQQQHFITTPYQLSLLHPTTFSYSFFTTTTSSSLHTITTPQLHNDNNFIEHP